MQSVIYGFCIFIAIWTVFLAIIRKDILIFLIWPILNVVQVWYCGTYISALCAHEWWIGKFIAFLIVFIILPFIFCLFTNLARDLSGQQWGKSHAINSVVVWICIFLIYVIA